MDRDYPALRIDDPGLPKLKIKRRKAVVWDQVFLMAPIQGKTGKAFERALLLSQARVLNNLRLLTQVIKDDEKSNQRKTFLSEAHVRLDDLYQQVMDLLGTRVLLLKNSVLCMSRHHDGHGYLWYPTTVNDFDNG